MSIGTRIKECRENLGMTQEELATILGVSKGAIGNYEAGIGYPKVENMTKLFKILKTDANFLFQDEISTKVKEMLTGPEREHIKKYRVLDKYGKKIINCVLDLEFERCNSNQEIKKFDTYNSEFAVARSSTRDFLNVPDEETEKTFTRIEPDPDF